MSEWKKTQLPPEGKYILGVWVIDILFAGEGSLIKHQCFIEDGKFYTNLPDGSVKAVPIPHYWKLDEDFPKEEEEE